MVALLSTCHTGFWAMSNFGHFWGQMRIVRGEMKTLRLPNPFGALEQWNTRKVKLQTEVTATRKDGSKLSQFLDMKDMNGNPASREEVLAEAMTIV